jgi:hypothetical protein
MHLASFAMKPYTLHFLLSQGELVLLPLSSAGLFVAISSWRRLRELRKDLNSRPSTRNWRTTFGVPALNLTTLSNMWQSLRLKCGASYQRLTSKFRSGRRVKIWTAEEEAEVMEGQIRRQRGWHGSGRYAAMWFCVVFSIAIVLLIRSPKYPVYEYHHVNVYSQAGPNQWWMGSNDGMGLMLWNGCPDFPNSDVIWPGYQARTFRYEDQGKCKSILRPDLGVWWERDERGNVAAIEEDSYGR